MEVDQNQLFVMKGYIEIILNSANECNSVEIFEPSELAQIYDKDICDMILYDPVTGQTQNGHALNWGFADANVRPNDACIPIRASHIKKYPKLFPPLQPNPEIRKGTLKEVIEFVWDDGLVMLGRLEGSQPIPNTDLKYPKQLASFPHKDEMGIYIRKRLGIPLDQKILREDLIKYGRDTISVSLLETGVYLLDFSIK